MKAISYGRTIKNLRSTFPSLIQEKYGPYSDLFFFLIKEPFALTQAVQFKPFVPAETLKACALIGLHLMAAGEVGSSGSQSPDVGDMGRHGCPKSPGWISSCSTSETSLGCEVYEHNNECQAIEVIGQDWSSEVVALFLEDWELWRVAVGCCHDATVSKHCCRKVL